MNFNLDTLLRQFSVWSTRLGLLAVVVCMPRSLQAETHRFSKVRKLSARFQPSDGTVKISWSQVTNARRYRYAIRSSDGVVLYSGTTRRHRKKLSSDPFVVNALYTVEVSVGPANGLRASPLKTASYQFTTRVPTRAIQRALKTTNSSGRSGSYYLPKNYPLKTVPVLVAFHGQGSSGEAMVNLFREQADTNGFIVIAPSSRIHPSGIVSWEVSDTPGEHTPDHTHVLDCIAEVLAIPDVTPNGFMAAGVSAGASSAAYLATNDARFGAMAILHGGIFARGFGENSVRAWFSTGTQDELRPPSEVKQHAANTSMLGFPEVSYQEYDYGHVVKKAEQDDLLAWWLTPLNTR